MNDKVFCVLGVVFILCEKIDIIVSTSNKYASPTPCEDDTDCDHLLQSKCEGSVCMCNGSRICEDTTRQVVTKIGESCSENDDCNIEHAKCIDQKCACKLGYVKSTNAKTCLAISEGIEGGCEDSVQCYSRISQSVCRGNKCVCQEHMHAVNGSCYRNVELGENCKELAECVFIEFAECKNSKCACVTNYVENRNRSRCLLVADGVGSICVEDAQCKKQLGGASECKDGRCACKEMYQLKNVTNTCVRDMLLGDTCKDHSDCHGPYPGLSRLECILGVCKCRAMYNELDGYCISSSQKFKASLLIIILALLLQL